MYRDRGMLTAAIWLWLFSIVSALNYCPNGWTENDYACFYYNPTPLTFTNADTTCSSLVAGARLASPRQLSEYSLFLPSIALNKNSATWIGGQYVGSAYVTLAGSTWPYTLPWGTGQPAASATGNCIAVQANNNKWMSDACTKQYPSICMFYTNMPSIKTEQFVTFNRLHGAGNFLGYRSPQYQSQDGLAYNTTLASGPTSLPDTAFELMSGTRSFISFASSPSSNATTNYLQQDFYFMFYIFMTSSVGPIIQYRFNRTNYGFNVWSYGNGTLLLDFVPASKYGPVSNKTYQATVPSGCVSLNQWSFLTINYIYSGGGLVKVWSGTSNTSPCLTTTIGKVDVEMSRSFDIGFRSGALKNGTSDDTFWSGKVSCLVSGAVAGPLSLFQIGETSLWCQQAMQEKTMDKTIAKRYGVQFYKEGTMVGFWPLNNFHRAREASGRLFQGRVSNNTYAFGPASQVNGSLVFDGLTSYVTLNGVPNQGQLAPSFSFLRRSFSLAVFVFVKKTTDGGPLASFGLDNGKTAPKTTTIHIVNGKDVRVVMPTLGGVSAWTDKTFSNCLTLGTWQQLGVVYDYPNGKLDVYVGNTKCAPTQTIGQADIEAHTNIVVGRTSDAAPPVFFKGKLSCFGIYADVLVGADMNQVATTCTDVLAVGQLFSGWLYKPQQLRVFLPLGRQYGLTDISGRQMHGATRGRLATGTGPLGHPFSATKFFNEPNSGIDIQMTMKENPYSVGGNESVTYMGYIYAQTNRSGNLPGDLQTVFEHWDPINGYGFHFMYNNTNQLYYNPASKGRSLRPTNIDVSSFNMAQTWRWFMVRYSRVTRKLTVSLDGITVSDLTIGWLLLNTFSPMTIGNRWTDTQRFSGKMACFMMYDTDLRDDEIKHTRDMCHAALIQTYGQPVDTTQCRHTTGGWEYVGKVSWTTSFRRCMKWSNQTTYADPNMFPDRSVSLAGSYCRNPEQNSATRTQPWCYTTDPTVPWEYCNIPMCSSAATWPFHAPENLLAFWPMGKGFGGSDVSGHDCHAGVGADTKFVTGPSGLANTATYFTDNTGKSSHYWVQHSNYSNFADFLDLGNKTPWYNGGYTYSIFVQYTASYSGLGAIWSWESTNGEGGVKGLIMRLAGSGTIQTTVIDYSYSKSYTITCSGMTNLNWYQITMVYLRSLRQINIYRDTTMCGSWSYDVSNMPSYQFGLYTLSGSFKFGRESDQTASNVALACASIYLQPLTLNEIVIVRQKCFETLAGKFSDVLLEPVRPTALFPMSAHTGGMNTRGPNHARYQLIEPIPNAFGVGQAAFAFGGTVMQYFYAMQDYASTLDVCSQARSFSLAAYVSTQTTGIGMSFHNKSATNMDDTNLPGKGIQMTFDKDLSKVPITAPYELKYSTNDDTQSGGNVIPNNQWSHVAITYDYPSDNLIMFVNGLLVYTKTLGRKTVCLSSGSINMGRLASMPIGSTPLPSGVYALPIRGAMHCAALFNRGLQTEKSVQQAAKYCSHPDQVGCFPMHVAGSSDFIYNPGFWLSENMTVANCRLQCGLANFQFAAIRSGDTCMCGNKYGTDGPEAPEKCTTVCTGGFFGWCGGVNHYSVYRSSMARAANQPAIKSVDYAGCMRDWLLRGTSCYRIFTIQRDFVSAQAVCQSYGAQLGVITEPTENEFVAENTPASIIAADGQVCLGVVSMSKQYKSKTIDGQISIYSNWTSLPNADGLWACLHPTSVRWMPIVPTVQKNFLCKKPAGPFTDFMANTKCAFGWSRFNDKCYLFNNQLLPYDLAKQACANYDPAASLLKIESQAQYDFIVDATDLQRPFWLGLQFSSVSNQFEWAVDGSQLGSSSFALWAGDERFDPSTRQCAYADPRTQFFWRTAECDGTKRYAYVCSYNLNISSTGTLGLASGRIIDYQLSTAGTNSTIANDARLGHDSAWCADPTEASSLTIDLRDYYNITELWMNGDPNSAAYCRQIFVEYSTDDGNTWTLYEYNTAQYFDGYTSTTVTQTPGPTYFIDANIDSTSTAKHTFEKPIVANKVRVTPFAMNIQACLQIEFIGSYANPSQQQRTLDIGFQPIRFEFTRLAGASVRYNASVYVNAARRRSTQLSVTERANTTEYVYYPRTLGWQKLVFTGIDAEGNKHELAYETTTSIALRSIQLNMCPIAVLYGTYAACEARVVGGYDFDLYTDYGFEQFGPKRVKSSRVEIGVTVPFTSSAAVVEDGDDNIYLMPNQLVRTNATVYAIEAVIKSTGWVTLQLYRPRCAIAGTYFCPVCHCCVKLSLKCSKQRAYDTYKCNSGYVKTGYNSTCTQSGGTDNLQIRNGFFAYTAVSINSPGIDYDLVVEWRKYFSATGNQVVYLNNGEVTEVTLGMFLAYFRNSTDRGKIRAYASSTVKEYILYKTGTFNTRATTGFFIPSTLSLSDTPIVHMVKLIGYSSVGVSFGRKWTGVTEGIHTIEIKAHDNFFRDINATFSYDIEVQYMCTGFQPVFDPISDAAESIPFTVPPHNGSKCQYLLDFGDGSAPIRFDYLTRNKTYFHVYRLFGSYNVTLTSWNLVYSKSVSVPIKIVFPIQKLSAYMANPPATEIGHNSTIVVTYAQASNVLTLVDVDANSSTPTVYNTSQFSPCPLELKWFDGMSKIGNDFCYKFVFPERDYESAEAYCASVGATLVHVASNDELEFLKDVMRLSGERTDIGAWTGYTQTKDNFKFWVSQEDKRSLPPPFWQEISGSYPRLNGGLCGYYDFPSRRLQNDNCTALRPFICKREASISSYCGPTPGWTYDPDTNRCFRVFTPLSTFIAAVLQCRQLGGQLAVAESNRTWSLIYGLTAKANPSISYYIGLWRPDGRNWQLYDGWQNFAPAFMTFDDQWTSPRPGTTTPRPFEGDNCVIMSGSTGRYRVVSCADMDGFVCEKSVYGLKPTRYAVRSASRRYIYPTQPPSTCPLGWTLNNDTNVCYKLFQGQAKTWQQAEDDCFSQGAHLASVNSSVDQAFFVAKVIGSYAGNVWIGLAEVGSPGGWTWRDGSLFSGLAADNPWGTGYPTAAYLGYAYFYANSPNWYEGIGNEQFAYACSKAAIPGSRKWAGSCPKSYSEFDGRCFKFFSASKNQALASTACINDGGGLATIRTYQDFLFVRGLLPLTTSKAFTGLQYLAASATWNWTADVRGQAADIVYPGLWANGEPSTSANGTCGIITRGSNLFLTSDLCSIPQSFICEQPAAYCPPQWTMWAGVCYRANFVRMHIQAGSDLYDLARVVCQVEDSLPISPINTEELNFAVTIANSSSFSFGYRRLSNSMGFVDMWGRLSVFAGWRGEPKFDDYYAVWNGTGVDYVVDGWTNVSLCQSPTKLNADVCIRQCMAMTDFDCKSVQYDGSSCEMTSLYPPDDWFGLRESHTKIDLYTMRQDLCSGDMLASVKQYEHSADTSDLLTGARVRLTGNNDGYVPQDENDTLTFQFANTIWLNGLILAKRDSVDEWLTKFKIQFTFDRSAWYDYQFPAGIDIAFSGNSVDEPMKYIALPKAILVKAMTIVPLEWYGSKPSYRLKLVGCGAVMFTDYVVNKYPVTKTFVSTVTAYSIRNNATAGPIDIPVQSKLKYVQYSSINALPWGEWATIPFTYGETASFSYPSANATFKGSYSPNVTILPLNKKGQIVISPQQYVDVGWYWSNLTLDNLLSDPVDNSTVLWVDYPVRNLKITTNATKTHGALQNQTIQVLVTMENCTRCNVSITYGAVDAVPPSYFNYYGFILENTAIFDIPMVSYPSLGGYYITAYANNYLPFTKTYTYDIYVQLQPLETTFNYTATTPNMIPYKGVAIVWFQFRFTGYVFAWPSNASMYLDFQDSTNLTKPFDNTKMPPFTIKPSVTDLVMGNISHPYTQYGTYSVYMEVFNRVGTVNGSATMDVDQEIVGLIISPDRIYLPPGGSITFNITWLWGTRFQWLISIPNPDGSIDYSPYTDWNVTTYTWNFWQVGVYYPCINATNLVSVYHNKTVVKPIIVQYVVLANGYRLTVNPTVGKLMFKDVNSQEGFSNTTLQLWINTKVQAPSEPWFTLYFDDGTQTAPNGTLNCNTELLNTVDGQWALCQKTFYIYKEARVFTPRIAICNYASCQSFQATYTIFIGVTNLKLWVSWTENATAKSVSWLPGYPRVDPNAATKDQTIPYEAFFPYGKALRILATAKFGEGLQYCFFSSGEGNLTDCSGEWTNTPQYIIKKFDYDTPCPANPFGKILLDGDCGLTLKVVASNPVDTATTTIKIYIQKPALNVKLIDNGPGCENVTYPNDLAFSQYATDACIQMDYGTNLLSDSAPQIKLYGAEYVCAFFYPGTEYKEVMKSLQSIPASQIDNKIIPIGGNYYRKGQYTVKAKIMNFVQQLDPSLFPDLIKKIKVTRGPCSLPKIYIDNTATTWYKKDELKVVTTLITKCASSLPVRFTWTILYRATASAAWTNVGAKYFKPSELDQSFDTIRNQSTVFDKTITFAAGALPYGTYSIKAWVTMVEEDDFTDSVIYQVEVGKSPLVVGLTPPGVRRDLVFKQAVRLNAWDLSYDPDLGGPESSKAGMKVYYFCKRDCDGSWPTFTSLEQVQSFISNPSSYPTNYPPFKWSNCKTDDANLKADGYQANGCFASSYHIRRLDDPDRTWGFPSLNPVNFTRLVPRILCGENATTDCTIYLSQIDPGNTLSIDSRYQFENQTYNLMAIVTKDERWQIATQSYRLERGEAPQVQIRIVTNCAYLHDAVAYMYNPTSRASFHSLLTDRIPGRMYFFNWQMMRVPFNKKILDLLENLEDAIENYVWPYEFWLNKTSTGRLVDDLSMNVGLFNYTDYASNFIAYVQVYRAGNPRPGISSLPFYVNTPPDASNVSCKSNYASGIALYTLFTFECTGFKSIHGPLTKFVFSLQACSYCPHVVMTSTISSPSLKAGIPLPPGVASESFLVTIFVDAIDAFDSLTRVQFKVRVEPQVDIAEILKVRDSYKDTIGKMKTEDVCQKMFTFSSLVKELVIDPMMEIDKDSYSALSNAKKKEIDEELAKDAIRYANDLKNVRNVIYNITDWVLSALVSKGISKDSNSIRTCCSSVAYTMSTPIWASENRTISNAIYIMNKLSAVLKEISESKTRDADRMDDTTSACFGAAGKTADCLEENLKQINQEAAAKKAEEDAKAKQDNDGSKEKDDKKNGDDKKKRKRRDSDVAEVSPFGTVKDAQYRANLMSAVLEIMHDIVLSGKVLQESSSIISGPGMSANIQKRFVGDLSNATIQSGTDGDCGSFTIGDAGIMFASTDPFLNIAGLNSADTKDALPLSERLKWVDLKLKASQQSGNPYMFDSSASLLNGQVQTLVFTNSSNQEIEVHDLPFEIEIVIESKNDRTPDQTELKSLSAAYPKSMKSMVLNVTSLSAMFVSVERWFIPNMCSNISTHDTALNLTCSGANTTTLMFESTNYTLPSLNITNEEVIFFVYIQRNEAPTTTSYDLSCTIPRGAFEREYIDATGLPWILEDLGASTLTTKASTTSNVTTTTTTAKSTTGVTTVSSTTITTTVKSLTTTEAAAITNAPVCNNATLYNVTCCNGTVTSNGSCSGHFVLPTTPAPGAIPVSQYKPKNCTRPTVPNRNTCFFDHRIVNVTEDIRLYKIAIRAIPLSAVRAFLQNWAKTTTQPITQKTALNVSFAELDTKSVRVGYKFSSFSTSCKYYDTPTKTWSTYGCRVGALSNPQGNPSTTQCFCNHLTTFSSSFDVPMNTFDPRDSAFTHLDTNPVCFTFGICILCCFFALLIWARKRDKEDEKRWGTMPLADNDPRDKYAYELTVWTGQRASSATSARVSFILLGDEGETPVHLIEDDSDRDVLRRGGIDSFLLLTPRSLGKLVQLRIWHDNSGSHPNWYFSRMQVHDIQRSRQYYFLCDRWLAIDEDDGMVERVVPVAGKKELAGFEHLFFTKSRRNLTDGHIWISVFSRPPLSKFTRCQRLTCCISVLYCTMVANIMFFGIDRDPPGSPRFSFGPVSMSTTKIFMSIISALITVPINLVIVQLFRMSRHRPTKAEQKIEELRRKAAKIQELEHKKKVASGLPTSPAKESIAAIANTSDRTTVEKTASNTSQRKSQRLKKKKKPFKLPWWCIIVAYVLAFATCGVAFWAIVEFGGALGPERATEWVIAMCISLFSDILCIQPVKILALALFYALIIRSPTKDDDIEEKASLKDDDVFFDEVPTEEEITARKKANDEDKREYVFLPPDPDELRLAREIRMKEQKMWKIIKEIGFYTFFLYLLMMVGFGTQDDWSMQLQRQMRRVYQAGSLATPPYNLSIPGDFENYNPKFDGHDEVWDNMVQESQFFTYLERTLIPSVLDGTWYNGRYSTSTDVFTKDQALFLVGNMRLRQLRITTDACRVPRNMRNVYTDNCLAPYSIWSEETRNFTSKWVPAPYSNTTFDKKGRPITVGDTRGFAYKSDIDDRGLPFQAALATYNGGGYIVDLGRKLRPAMEKIAWLKNSKWIDEKTRAIFIEFNLYCPNRNLFAISQSVVEFFPGGSIVLFPYFYITRVDAYYGSFAIVLLAFQFITLAIVLGLFVREIKLAIKHKRQYWTDWWAVIEFTHLLCCILTAVMFMVRYAMSRLVVGDNYKKTHKNSYTNFTIFITYDQLVTGFVACVVFVAFLKMIRLLRFNRRLLISISTLRHARSMLLSFFVVFFVAYLAFAQLGYLAFGSRHSGFASFVTSLETLFSMLLGVYDYKGISQANAYIGPAFFTFYTVSINIFLLNAFVALLMVAYEEVRADDTKIGNEYEIVDFMMNKFKAFIGIAPKHAPTLSIDKRFAYLDAIAHEDEIDKFTSRMENLMSKLDRHLEKTKAQFAGMFDQRFLQRKLREVYVTD